MALAPLEDQGWSDYWSGSGVADGEADPLAAGDSEPDGSADGEPDAPADGDGGAENDGTGSGVGSGANRDGTPSAERMKIETKMANTIRTHGFARRSSRVGSAPR